MGGSNITNQKRSIRHTRRRCGQQCTRCTVWCLPLDRCLLESLALRRCAYDSNGTSGSMNDLWQYSGGQWTWVGGFELANFWGVYGIQGTPSANNLQGAQWTWVSGSSLGNQSSYYSTEGSLAPGNTPAGRVSPPRWTDGNGNLWLFGGWTMTGATYGNLNDLWMHMP
jgi:hypothetical protein